jgi:IS30 family transposase
MEQKHYTLLSIEDRETISRGLSANLSYAEIARQIGRPTLAVSREVKNNYGRYVYCSCSAQRMALKLMGRRRGGKRKLCQNKRLAGYVHLNSLVTNISASCGEILTREIGFS